MRALLIIGMFLMTARVMAATVADERGVALRGLTVEFTDALTSMPILQSRSVQLWLRGAARGGVLHAESGVCMIGQMQVPTSEWRVLLNGHATLPASEANRGFFLAVELKNPRGLSGPIQCRDIQLILE